MANVALHDLLKLESLDVFNSQMGDVQVTIGSEKGSHKALIDSIPVRDNLIARAATAYLVKMGLRGDVAFSIEKNIPAGAGLAGGSSDAAAALRLMNEKLTGFTPGELMALGSEVGADVPYCLQGGLAICRGKGDIVEPVTGNFPYWVLIINDGIHIDTGSAYKALSRSGGTDSARETAIGRRTRQIVDAVSKGSIETLRQIAVNDFEQPVFVQHPSIGRLKDRLYDLGADFSGLTGSGSSMIGVFIKEDKAVEVHAKLRKAHKEVILTNFL